MSFHHLRRIASVGSSALLALMILGPQVATAATPLVDVGSLTAQTNTSAASPTTVSIGETVWFRTTLENKDTSTISQLFLGVFSDATLYSFGTPVKYAVTLTKNGSTVANGCGPGTSVAKVSCSVRNVKPDDIVQATFVLVVPAGTPEVPYAGQDSCPIGDGIGYDNVLSAGATVLPGPATCVLSMWSANGAPSSDGGSSHGDTWNFNDGVKINGDLTDFRSRYIYQPGQSFVANDQAINGDDNPHSTAAYAPLLGNTPAVGIPITVFDLECQGDETEGLCTTTDAFGEISVVDVNGGTVAGATWYKFLIQLDASEIPSNVNKNNVLIHHTWTAPTAGAEAIGARCTIPRGQTTPTNIPCLTVQRLAGNDLGITVYSLHNGTMRPGY